MLAERFFLFLLYSVLWIAHARTDGVGCVHYISTVHSCDVRRVLYGNIMNSFRPITARAFLRTFYDKKYLYSEFEYSIRARLQRYPQLYYILMCHRHINKQGEEQTSFDVEWHETRFLSLLQGLALRKTFTFIMGFSNIIWDRIFYEDYPLIYHETDFRVQ